MVVKKGKHYASDKINYSLQLCTETTKAITG